MKVTRRDFVKHSSLSAVAGAAATVVPHCVLGGTRHVAPSDHMHIAGVGIGGMGAANLRNLESEHIVALCDVDKNFAARTIKRYPKATFYFDYREMLEKQKDIV